MRRALLSVSDKTGIVEFGRALGALGVEILSTGGTARSLADAGVAVTEVSDYTGFPEMLDGRVKTLHPRVHGGLLARRDLPEHMAALQAQGIDTIDLLAVNLYPFQQTVARPDCSLEEAIENIDIGGPAMLRAAAKNHDGVTVVVDPADYGSVLAQISGHGGVDRTSRFALATKVYAHTAGYDSAIAGYLSSFAADGSRAPYPEVLGLQLRKVQSLRYGENPHQTAAFYRDVEPPAGALANYRQLQGKELSYNNIADADAAYELVAEFEAPACVIVKHANPCGVAVGTDLATAYTRALECDAVSAFGGVIAVNRTLTGADAKLITDIFTEVVIAPGADDEAQAVFAAKKNLRLLLTDGLPDPLAAGEVFRSVAGGFLVQSRDRSRIAPSDLKIVTRRQPTPQEIEDMLFAFTVAKHVKSNAIVYAKDGQTAGIGAGQMNRRDSARIAAIRAREAGEAKGLAHSLAQGSACASEAFFPFADGLLEAVAAGATAVIQPGGSIRDDEVIAAADEAGVAMAFTGVRVFRH